MFFDGRQLAASILALFIAVGGDRRAHLPPEGLARRLGCTASSACAPFSRSSRGFASATCTPCSSTRDYSDVSAEAEEGRGPPAVPLPRVLPLLHRVEVLPRARLREPLRLHGVRRSRDCTRGEPPAAHQRRTFATSATCSSTRRTTRPSPTARTTGGRTSPTRGGPRSRATCASSTISSPTTGGTASSTTRGSTRRRAGCSWGARSRTRSRSASGSSPPTSSSTSLDVAPPHRVLLRPAARVRERDGASSRRSTSARASSRATAGTAARICASRGSPRSSSVWRP